jgi:hypothetical protein
MQGTVVAMLMVLAGLGSSNKENVDQEPLPGYTDSATPADPQLLAPPVSADSAAPADSKPALPPVYAPYDAGPYNSGYAPSHSVGHILYETLYSFCHGHDDDVMTAKEIESAFYSGTYPGLYDYPPSAVLSPDAPPQEAGPK